MIRFFALFLACSANAALAQQAIGPEDFKRLTEGKTLHFYTRDGVFFGVEQFYTRQRTTWQIPNGECSDGEWFYSGPFVCFQYGTVDPPQCWEFFKTNNGFSARAEGASPELDIEVQKIDTQPLNCKAPDFGA